MTEIRSPDGIWVYFSLSLCLLVCLYSAGLMTEIRSRDGIWVYFSLFPYV